MRLRLSPSLSWLLPAAVEQRYAALRRDLRRIAGDLTGRRPPPFSVREPLRRHRLAEGAPPRPAVPRSPAARGAPRALRVERIVRDTAERASIHLADPTGEPLGVVQGQLLTLLVKLPTGEVLRRAYSIDMHPTGVVIVVHRGRGDRVSAFLHDSLREGDSLDALYAGRSV